MAINFLHPHVLTNVVDNTQTNSSATTSGSILYQPYFSEKGISNKIEVFNNLSTFLNQKGNPDYKKYGQTSYNIINWLRGGGQVVGIRLMPEDSSFANIGINVRTKIEKVEETVGEEGSAQTISYDCMKVMLEPFTIEDLNSTDTNSISDALSHYVSDKTEDGYKDHAFLLFKSKGLGNYGNNLSVRLSNNTTANKTYDFKCYNFSAGYTKNSGNSNTVNEGPVTVSLYPNALTNGGSSLYISQIIEDYFSDIECIVNEDKDNGYISLVEEALKLLDENKKPVFTSNSEADSTAIDISLIDFINGNSKYLVVDETSVKNIFGQDIKLLSGSNGSLSTTITRTDGSFTTDDDLTSFDQDTMTKLLMQAYSGTICPEIEDKRQYPIDVLLDGNYPLSVKQQMNAFVKDRGDCICILDTGEINTPARTVDTVNSNYSFDDYLTSIWSQWFTINDSYTQKDIGVGPTYFLASKIPSVDSNYGVQQPFVGPSRGIINGMKSVNWSPNDDEQEMLYEAKINYAVQNYKNTKFMGQLTSQNKSSALSDINHVRVMLKIIREVEELMENYIFELGTSSTFNSINTSINNALTKWVTNGSCSSCSGSVSQTAIEAEQKIAHVTVSIVFIDVLERIVIDINVGR